MEQTEEIHHVPEEQHRTESGKAFSFDTLLGTYKWASIAFSFILIVVLLAVTQRNIFLINTPSTGHLPAVSIPVASPTTIPVITEEVSPKPTISTSITPSISPSVSVSPSPNLSPSPSQSLTSTKSAEHFTRKVLLIIYNPVYADGKKLTVKKSWSDPDNLTSQLINWFSTTSSGRVTYTVTERHDVNDFSPSTPKYNTTTYDSCLSNNANCYKVDGSWVMTDYYAILNTFSVCNKVNANQVDEVWLFGGPYFGYYESRLAGPHAFYFNSSPLTESSCNKLVPIMGFSYERGLGEMIEDYGHRFESTMYRVYSGSYNNWIAFTSNEKRKSLTKFTGVGTIHTPANAQYDYEWSNTSVTQSFADEFYTKYPNFNERVVKSVSCATWSCTNVGYFTWFYRHIPDYSGKGPDNKLMDWWAYYVDPNRVLQ